MHPDVKKGFDKWLKLACYAFAIDWFLGLLAVLPEKTADKVLTYVINKFF